MDFDSSLYVPHVVLEVVVKTLASKEREWLEEVRETVWMYNKNLSHCIYYRSFHQKDNVRGSFLD
jgi:hypothetical protein